jgi:DNA-directed RNA polymerase subunit RPC12/RpoP
MPFTTRCPRCGDEPTLPHREEGRDVTCRECGQRFTARAMSARQRALASLPGPLQAVMQLFLWLILAGLLFGAVALLWRLFVGNTPSTPP